MKTFEKNILKHEIDPAYFSSVQGLAQQACLKKAEIDYNHMRQYYATNAKDDRKRNKR